MHGLPERLADPITRRVFALGVVGYILLAVGLSSGVFLFSMARPWLTVQAMVVALAVSLAVGITLSRTHAYWWSAAGTAAAGLVFAVLTGLAVWRTLRRGDLHLYAAY
jgi:FtsH-binding integral membrane protein